MTETQPTRFPPAAYVLVAVLLWSTGGLFIKYTSLDAFSVNLGRSFFAAIVVAIFTYKKGLKLDKFTLFTSFLYAGTLSAFVYANKNTTAANAIFLQYTAPIYILLFSPIILKEKFRVPDLFTVIICLGGMVLFFFEAPGANAATAPNIYLGNIAGLISGAFFGFYFIFLRHPRSLAKNPALSVFYGNIIIVVLMTPLVLTNLPARVGVSDFAAIFFLGTIQIGLAYILFTQGIAAGVRSMDASIIGFFEPLLNPVWVFFMMGEKPSAWALLGGAVIIAAVAFHTFQQARTNAVNKAGVAAAEIALEEESTPPFKIIDILKTIAHHKKCTGKRRDGGDAKSFIYVVPKLQNSKKSANLPRFTTGLKNRENDRSLKQALYEKARLL